MIVSIVVVMVGVSRVRVWFDYYKIGFEIVVVANEDWPNYQRGNSNAWTLRLFTLNVTCVNLRTLRLTWPGCSQ